MASRSNKTLIAYVPSPHRGYVQLFEKYAGGVLFVLGPDIIADFQPLVRNLPANDPSDVVMMVQSLGIFSDVRMMTKGTIRSVVGMANIVMPDEEVSRAVANQYLKGCEVKFEDTWRLRWHWEEATKKTVPVEEGVIISKSEFDREMMTKALGLAEKSPDWWRQIGALLVRDGKVLLAGYNQHVPHEQSLYLEGDPRSNFEPGQHIEVSSALHAEAGVIATAAARGIKTEGCDMYVTTFPCPQCAYYLAEARLVRLFFTEGYSLVSGADTLRAKGVEIVRVDMNSPSS